MEDDKVPNKYSLSVFLPFYNEEGNIRSALDQTVAVLGRMKEISEYEIIVVDDGSHDRTRQVAEELVKENDHIRLIVHNGNLGYGQALVSGIRAARYDYIFFTDGDLQFDIGELRKLTAYIPEHEVVIGYRAHRRDPFMRLLNAKGWNFLNRLFFGLKVKDIDCAFKLFRRELVQNMTSVSGGAMLSAELLIRIQRKGIEIKEIPVTHLPRKKGSPTGAKVGVIVRAFGELWWLYRNTNLGNPSFLQAIRFITVGIMNTVVDVIVYYFLTRYTTFFPAHITSTRIISFLSGSVCSFVLNRVWTFEKRGAVGAFEFVKFYVTIGASLIIGVASMQLFIKVFHLYDLIALGFSVIITFAWNFTISKLWVFKKKLNVL